MNNTISTFSPNFNGKLILKDKTISHIELANEVLQNKTLQDIATESDKDIFISQAKKYAKTTRNNHYEGDPLYKVFLSTEDKSFLGRIKQFFGLNKVSLSRHYHTPDTFVDKILQPSHLIKRIQKLNLK